MRKCGMMKKVIIYILCSFALLADISIADDENFLINENSNNRTTRITNVKTKINPDNILKEGTTDDLYSFIMQYPKLFKTENCTLKRIKTNSYNNKHFVVYQQMYNNTPVLDAYIKATVLQNGTIARVSTSFVDISDVEINPIITESEANTLACEANSITETEMTSFEIENNNLVFYHNYLTEQTTLCWNITINGHSNGKTINRQVLVNAINGEIIKNQSQLYGVSGTIQLKAWSGQWGSSPGPDITAPAKYEKIDLRNILGQYVESTYANSSGYYYAPNPSNFQSIRSCLDGIYAHLEHDNGDRASYSSSSQFSWTWNSSGDYNEYHLYYWMNEARLDFLSDVSGFSTNYYNSPVVSG